MSARLTYRSYEAQEAFVAECHRRIGEWRVPHELRLVQTGLGPTTVLVAGGPTGVNGHSRPVLVVPGAHLAAAALLPLAAALAHTRQVLVVDPPGQPGLSYPKRPGHFGAYGAWLDEVVATLGQKPTVVGHASGAAIALLADPDAVADVVLANPAGIVKATRSLSVRVDDARWRLQPSARTARALAQQLAAPVTTVDDATVRWLELVATHARPSSTTSAVLGADVLEPWAARSASLRVLAGAHDPLFPPDRLTPATSRHGVATTIVQGAGHLLPVERPEAIAAALG